MESEHRTLSSSFLGGAFSKFGFPNPTIPPVKQQVLPPLPYHKLLVCRKQSDHMALCGALRRNVEMRMVKLYNYFWNVLGAF